MDSDNILSILASLGAGGPPPGADAPDVQLPGVPQAAPVNVLQPPVQAPPQPSPIVQQAIADSPQPARPRRSLLDTIGRISDVFAQVGGAAPLYQPTLNAREDRALALGDHARKVDEDTIKLATDKFALGDLHNTRLGQVARGLKALQTAGGDINQAWPILAARMQLDPETIQSVGKAIATDPHALDGLIAATTDPKYDQSKYGGSVVYAKNKDGKIVAYQPSLGNDDARSILPDGVEAIDPLKFVDTGAAQVGVGTRSGNVTRILPKMEAPGKAADRQERAREADNRNRTTITVAGMPARTNAAPGGKNAVVDGNVPALLDNIQSGFADLHRMKALPGEGSAVQQIEGAIGRTALGQKAGEQAGSLSAQKRVEIMKNVSALQQAMLKSLPASATRTKFEQEMLARGLPDPSKMSYETAQTVIRQLRESYARAVAVSTRQAAPRRSGNSGWSVVGVK